MNIVNSVKSVGFTDRKSFKAVSISPTFKYRRKRFLERIFLAPDKIFCVASKPESAIITDYNITKTCPCSMKQFLKVEKMIFLDVKM